MCKSRFWLFSGLLLTSVLLTGCVSIPDSVKGRTAAPQQDLVQVLRAPQHYVGREGRFGGKVVAVSNEQGTTRLEIAAMPLDSAARPVLGSPTIGRIFANIHGFVDPVNVSNQMVTVVGKIGEPVKGKIGDADYTYVTLDVTGYQRWHAVQQVVGPPQPMGPWIWYGPGHYHHRGYWGPSGWGYYPSAPAQVQTVLTE